MSQVGFYVEAEVRMDALLVPLSWWTRSIPMFGPGVYAPRSFTPVVSQVYGSGVVVSDFVPA